MGGSACPTIPRRVVLQWGCSCSALKEARETECWVLAGGEWGLWLILAAEDLLVVLLLLYARRLSAVEHGQSWAADYQR